MDGFEKVGYTCLGIIVLGYLGLMFAGMFAAGPLGLIGLVVFVGLGALVIKVLKERMQNGTWARTSSPGYVIWSGVK